MEFFFRLSMIVVHGYLDDVFCEITGEIWAWVFPHISTSWNGALIREQENHVEHSFGIRWKSFEPLHAIPPDSQRILYSSVRKRPEPR